YLNLRHLQGYGAIVPSEFEGVVDDNTLKKIQSYVSEKIRFGFLSSLFGNIAAILFIFGGLLDIYNTWIMSLNLPFIVLGIMFFLLLNYAYTFISVPFVLYDIFKIENKCGFNLMTPKIWVIDFIKMIFLLTLVVILVASVGLWMIQWSPNYWWIWIWGFFLLFSILIMYISPYVIEPLFNKFTAIDAKDLEQKIKELMQKVNIKVSRVFKMDASKRSRHTNAYFSGIGRVRRIIIYDTLLEKMEDDEILSVLAHEAGHWKKKHVLKMIILAEVVSLIGVYLSFRILRTDVLTYIFDISHESLFAKIVLLGFVGGIFSLPLNPIRNYISRRFEKEADKFACGLTGKKDAMVSAIIKLSRDNLSNLHPHPLYAAFYYSHPPVIERIRDIKTID
ncbi:MAG: M48 family metallopeptidase, partial [Nitrospirota bacterium]